MKKQDNENRARNSEIALDLTVAWASTIALQRALVPKRAIGRIPFGDTHIFSLVTPKADDHEGSNRRHVALYNAILNDLPPAFREREHTADRNPSITVVSVSARCAQRGLTEVFQISFTPRASGGNRVSSRAVTAGDKHGDDDDVGDVGDDADGVVTGLIRDVCLRLGIFCNTLAEADGSWSPGFEIASVVHEGQAVDGIAEEMGCFERLAIQKKTVIGGWDVRSWVLVAQ